MNKHVKLLNSQNPFFSCASTKVQHFLEYKKLSYICDEKFKIIIVYAHNKTRIDVFINNKNEGKESWNE